jgi:hypothetical protein
MLTFSASSASDEDDKTSKTGSTFVWTFAIWVLNFVVVTSATAEQFEMLGLGDRYDYHDVVMKIALSTTIACALFMFCACVTVTSENSACAAITSVLSVLITLGVCISLVVMYVYVGGMWHSDPKHTLFFYNTFWNEGVTQPAIDRATLAHNFTASMGGITTVTPFDPSALAPMWVYTMSDVLVRLTAFSLMFLPVLLAVCLVCGGAAMLCSKCAS